MTQIVNGERKLSLGSLTPTRDFNYISDTVNGFISAARSEKAVGEVVNIGGSNEISMADLVTLISEIMGAETEVKVERNRIRPEMSEVNRLYACSDKIRKLADWSPEYAGLEGLRRGLQLTADWFSNPANVSVYKSHLYNM